MTKATIIVSVRQAIRNTKSMLYPLILVTVSLLSFNAIAAGPDIETCPALDTIHFDPAKKQWVTTEPGWVSSKGENSSIPFQYGQVITMNSSKVVCNYVDSGNGPLRFILHKDGDLIHENGTWEKMEHGNNVYLCTSKADQCSFEFLNEDVNSTDRRKSPF